MSSYRNPAHRNSARDMRTVGRQFAQDKRDAASRKAISDAEAAARDAREACMYGTTAGTPERDAAWTAMETAEAALAALDPDNSYFS